MSDRAVMCGAGCGRPVSIEHYPFCGPCALQKRLGHNVCSACGTPMQKDEQCAVCAQEEPIDGSR